MTCLKTALASSTYDKKYSARVSCGLTSDCPTDLSLEACNLILGNFCTDMYKNINTIYMLRVMVLITYKITINWKNSPTLGQWKQRLNKLNCMGNITVTIQLKMD